MTDELTVRTLGLLGRKPHPAEIHAIWVDHFVGGTLVFGLFMIGSSVMSSSVDGLATLLVRAPRRPSC